MTDEVMVAQLDIFEVHRLEKVRETATHTHREAHGAIGHNLSGQQGLLLDHGGQAGGARGGADTQYKKGKMKMPMGIPPPPLGPIAMPPPMPPGMLPGPPPPPPGMVGMEMPMGMPMAAPVAAVVKDKKKKKEKPSSLAFFFAGQAPGRKDSLKSAKKLESEGGGVVEEIVEIVDPHGITVLEDDVIAVPVVTVEPAAVVAKKAASKQTKKSASKPVKAVKSAPNGAAIADIVTVKSAKPSAPNGKAAAGTEEGCIVM